MNKDYEDQYQYSKVMCPVTRKLLVVWRLILILVVGATGLCCEEIGRNDLCKVVVHVI